MCAGGFFVLFFYIICVGRSTEQRQQGLKTSHVSQAEQVNHSGSASTSSNTLSEACNLPLSYLLELNLGQKKVCFSCDHTSLTAFILPLELYSNQSCNVVLEISLF